MHRRRIFRPARSFPRLPVVLAATLAAALVTGLGLPSDLLGSAPREQDWSALATEVRVVDGETLRLGDRMVRLAELDAPERGQGCADAAGRPFDCGAGAAEALSRLVNGRSVLCRVQGRDRFGRGLATCHAGGMELNAGMVGAGWALADGGEGRLQATEDTARAEARGLWAQGFARPEDWQRRF